MINHNSIGIFRLPFCQVLGEETVLISVNTIHWTLFTGWHTIRWTSVISSKIIINLIKWGFSESADRKRH